MGSDSVAQARELVTALSRFCRTVEAIATSESDRTDVQRVASAVPPAHSARVGDPRAQVLFLTHLVQEAAGVLDQLLAERSPSERSPSAPIPGRGGGHSRPSGSGVPDQPFGEAPKEPA